MVANSVTGVSGMAQLIRSRRRSLVHWERKLYHCLMGTACFFLYAFFLDRNQALWALGTVGGVLVVGDVLRFRFPLLNGLVVKYFGPVMRREQLKGPSASTYYVIALTLLTVFFPKPTVLISVLLLAFGDSAASLVGTQWGRRRVFGGKTVEGAAANFLASLLVVYLAARFYFGLSAADGLLLGWVSALASVVMEILPLPVDDNLSLPIGSAVILTLFLRFIPLF